MVKNNENIELSPACHVLIWHGRYDLTFPQCYPSKTYLFFKAIDRWAVFLSLGLIYAPSMVLFQSYPVNENAYVVGSLVGYDLPGRQDMLYFHLCVP